MSHRTLIAGLLFTSVLYAQTAPPKSTAKNPASPTKSAAATPANAAVKKNTKKSKKKKPTPVVVEQQVPAPPPPPPTLAQQSPVAPRVTYQGGLMTIDAPNSTLGDIIGQVKKLTGSTVDGPTNLNDRVAVRIGPGTPRDVLSTLLHGSRFDFVLMGTPQQPTGVSKIVLIARSGTTEPAPTVQANNNNVQQRPAPPRPAQPQVANTDSEDEDSGDRDDEPAVNPAVNQPPDQPEYNPQLNPPPTPPDQNQNQNPNAQQQAQPKTPEQLYKELQDLERQRQQPQQNGQQPPPPPQ